jgi:hypothetical protein
MAEFEIDLKALYNRFYGIPNYVGYPFRPIGFNLPSIGPDGIQVEPGKRPNSLKYNAPEIDTEVPDGATKSPLGTYYHFRTNLDGFVLPNEPLIGISCSKNIIKTAIDGMDGTFKELYSMNDYTITIKGIAVDEENPDRYPQVAINRIREICEKRKSVEIINPLTTYFNIGLIAIESWDIPEVQGAFGMQPYTITGVSDKEYQLILKKGGNR